MNATVATKTGRFAKPVVLSSGSTLSCPLLPTITCDIGDILTDA